MNQAELERSVDRVLSLVSRESDPKRMTRKNYHDFLTDVMQELESKLEALEEEDPDVASRDDDEMEEGDLFDAPTGGGDDDDDDDDEDQDDDDIPGDYEG